MRDSITLGQHLVYEGDTLGMFGENRNTAFQRSGFSQEGGKGPKHQ
jgi:hypothetical protein